MFITASDSSSRCYMRLLQLMDPQWYPRVLRVNFDSWALSPRI